MLLISKDFESCLISLKEPYKPLIPLWKRGIKGNFKNKCRAL